MTSDISNPLNSLERTNLRRCEKTIERGCQTFVKVGSALMEIRDSKLYRETHTSFPAYCKDRWGFGDSRARQLIGAAETAKELQGPTTPKAGENGQQPGQDGAQSVTRVTPASEKQTRKLARLPKDQRAGAWADAVEEAGGKQPTAAKLREVVDRYAADNEGYEEPPPEVDGEPRRTKSQRSKASKELTPAERDLAEARAQIKIWQETIGRWMRAIDTYRHKWPGPQGDKVVEAAKPFYEALKAWGKGIK